jgi:hypothetical protein
MKEAAFDGISREFGSVSTRRGFVKLLGGFVAAAAVSAAGLGEPAAAKRKKTCRRPCNSEEKCVRGKCVPIGRPQNAACRSWVLSGGQGTNDPIAVDDDLQVTLNGTVILNNADKMAGTIPALRFQANPGDSLGVVATDVYASCRSLSPLWLHCETSGKRRQLTPGQPDGCAPGRTPGAFFSQTFQVKV